MNRLKNKDGSAILWTVLLTVIITILLGTLLTLSYGYHNSTIATVTKQQAYFTARSATDMLISELGEKGADSNLMPRNKGSKVTVDDFNFDESMKMGKANAVIEKTSEDTVEVKVTATYADSKYTMTATLKNQPIFFGGIAVKRLNIPATSTFTLTEKTDLYIDDEGQFTGKLNLGGNLITKGDIKLLAGSTVAGTTFSNDVFFDNNSATKNPKKKIWDSSRFIISNYTLEAKYPGFVQTTRMLVRSIFSGNYNYQLCNNFYSSAFNPSLVDTWQVDKFAWHNNIRYIRVAFYDRIILTDKDAYDVNQISYSNTGYTSIKDDVTSIAYVLVDKDCKLRIRYGLTTDYAGFLGFMQDISNALLDKKLSYINVYLDDGAVLELGNSAGNSDTALKRLNFYMSIYGTENSKVVLHNNVKVHGSINVGELEIRPGANATVKYITSNGGQVAKQKVDEIWTISNYTD